jgi:hypothetical protein
MGRWVFNEEGRKAGRKRGMKMDGGSYGLMEFLASCLPYSNLFVVPGVLWRL